MCNVAPDMMYTPFLRDYVVHVQMYTFKKENSTGQFVVGYAGK